MGVFSEKGNTPFSKKFLKIMEFVSLFPQKSDFIYEESNKGGQYHEKI